MAPKEQTILLAQRQEIKKFTRACLGAFFAFLVCMGILAGTGSAGRQIRHTELAQPGAGNVVQDAEEDADDQVDQHISLRMHRRLQRPV